jgi:hypothetical protein
MKFIIVFGALFYIVIGEWSLKLTEQGLKVLINNFLLQEKNLSL